MIISGSLMGVTTRSSLEIRLVISSFEHFNVTPSHNMHENNKRSWLRSMAGFWPDSLRMRSAMLGEEGRFTLQKF